MPAIESDSSETSSSDDEIESTLISKTVGELTLKDDENISYLAQLPDDYEEGGESDDDQRLPRVIQSSSFGQLDDDTDSKKKRKKRKRTYFICVSMCKYECVRRAAKRLNFREVGDDDDWNVYWTDTSVGIERVAQMKKWQKINHFPGMSEICRKDSLTRNMSRMMKMFPKEYNFYPKAWCLPADYSDFGKYCQEKKYKTYISKPDVGCQGRGIFITRNPQKDIKPQDNFVVQLYIARPFLVDGYKFDLRVYVAVTSCDPFRIFVYKDGLARFTTQHYEEPSTSNCKDIFMHLTNYAIQKRSDDFIRDEDTGTKRRITTINKWLVEHGVDINKLWSEIDDIIIKVLISAHSVLKHNYRACFPNHYRGSACFEILGFDILLDRKLKPYVLEVNHSPSFTTDSKLDREIKDALIFDTLLLLNMPAADKRKFLEEEKRKAKDRLFHKAAGKKDSKFREEQEDLAQQWQKEIEKWEDTHSGNYRRIYPGPTTDRYEKFFTQSGTLYSETAASKARLEQARAQIDELQRNQDKINAFKNKKTNNSRELCGESPTRRPLASLKSSRSSSFNRTPLKRLTANQNIKCPVMPYGDSGKAVEIDENEELERIMSLKQRETLIRGMGIIDMCHRLLFGTAGTIANLPLTSNYTNMPPINLSNASHNLSLLQYVGSSKLPPNRYSGTAVLQQYFTNQTQPKLEGSTTNSGSRNSRYQRSGNTSNRHNMSSSNYSLMLPHDDTLNSANISHNLAIHAERPDRFYLPNALPQTTTTLLPKTGLDIRTKSANTIPRQRTVDNSKEIVINGESVSVQKKLQMYDTDSYENLKKLQLIKLPSSNKVHTDQ
ncbi:unnamed protein product [Didymodactylos carnosus]|uniref:Tubulin polyglutamylase ttll6 n=1 Tax=Didymodactylos carnosus TaxID=1234261 RepID=A0A813PSB3_9BILA|nr:unnamed protein product [Didymodactylos carnosus]CAF0856242.1 unnamed protein product [Didymodactylos carnosus]CAF3535610.1 unnamed protein product [Didymodactylos carnosus]CAF3641277.1 unnamed protein product [Didymodactylos carnosus]